MQRTACASAGSNGEVLHAVLIAPLLVGTCNRVLESGRVRGVTGDGNADVLELHDCNAFRNVICAVALNVRTRAVGISLFADNLNFFCVRIELGLNIRKAVDSGDDERSVLAETVEDNTQRLRSDLVRVQSDLDSTLSSREGLVASEECEALGLLGKEHFAQITVAEADLTVFSNRARDAECLQADADSGSSVSSLRAAHLDSNRAAYGVSPLCVLKADRLCFLYDGVRVDALLFADGLALINGIDAVFFQDGEDFRLTSLITFKCSHFSCPPYSLRGSMYLTASLNLPYVPIDFLYASFGSMPALMKSVILPRETNS